MSRTIYANVFSHEQMFGKNGKHIITFPWPTGRIIVANDHKKNDLTLTLKSGTTNTTQDITIKAGEAFDMEFRTTSLKLSGDFIPHRVWGFG